MSFCSYILLLLKSCFHSICRCLALSSCLCCSCSLDSAVLCAFDSILKGILKADSKFRKDALAVVFKSGIRIIAEERISFLRIFLVCDLVVEVNELGEGLAHDELGCCLNRSIVTADLVNVLEEFAAGLVVAGYDVACAGLALVSQSKHCICNVSNVYECTAALLRRDGTVVKIAVQDLVDLVVFGITWTDDERRENHYGIKSVE